MNACPDCKCQFSQPFKCITCGAEKLYDTTVRSQAKRIAYLEQELVTAAECLHAFTPVGTRLVDAFITKWRDFVPSDAGVSNE